VEEAGVLDAAAAAAASLDLSGQERTANLVVQQVVADVLHQVVLEAHRSAAQLSTARSSSGAVRRHPAAVAGGDEESTDSEPAAGGP
jgi:hypothetical protein